MRKLPGAVVISVAFLAAGVRPPGEDQASVIFVGKVVKLGAVSFAGVSASRKTAIVHVESVVTKPPSVSLAAGSDVTVELKDPTLFKEGSEATFYTEGWILGKGVALRELSHEASSTKAPPPAGQLERKVSEARQKRDDAALAARLKSADMVVSGQVLNVRPAAAAGGRKFVTEHDPDWQEATIRVESGVKGAKSGDQVVVRFPGSQDVRFHGVPRFRPDQKGVFLLRRDTVTGLPGAMLGTAQVQAYTAGDAADVLPLAYTTRVSRLMKSR